MVSEAILWCDSLQHASLMFSLPRMGTLWKRLLQPTLILHWARGLSSLNGSGLLSSNTITLLVNNQHCIPRLKKWLKDPNKGVMLWNSLTFNSFSLHFAYSIIYIIQWRFQTQSTHVRLMCSYSDVTLITSLMTHVMTHVTIHGDPYLVNPKPYLVYKDPCKETCLSGLFFCAIQVVPSKLDRTSFNPYCPWCSVGLVDFLISYRLLTPCARRRFAQSWVYNWFNRSDSAEWHRGLLVTVNEKKRICNGNNKEEANCYR